MIRLDFNAAAIFDRLEQVSRKLDDMTPLHQEIGQYMVEATKERFRASTAPDGTRWRDKRPATLEAYLRRGDGNRPKPLVGPSGRLGREIAALASQGGVEIGSALEYSAVMQEGAGKGAFGVNRAGRPIPWGDIPARPFLGISDRDEREILDIADEYLADAVGG